MGDKMNKKGFTITELLVSFAIVSVVIIYLLRATTNVIVKENDLIVLQEFNVFESTLLNKFYDDMQELNSVKIEYKDNEINFIDNNTNIVYKTISFVNTNDQKGIYYDDILYELPTSAKFNNENLYTKEEGIYASGYINNYTIITVPITVNKKQKDVKLIIQNHESIVQEDNDNYLIKANISGLNSKAKDSFLNGPIKKEEIESIKFETSKNVPEGVIGSFDVSQEQNESIMAWYKDSDKNNLYELYIGQDGGVKANSNSSYLFQYLSKITVLDLSNLDTSNVTNMEEMFKECSALTSLDLSNFDTSKVTKMDMMFEGCSSLTNLDLSNLDTSNVTNMEEMFKECSALANLNLGEKFDTSKVIDMRFIFDGCSSLTSLDLGKKFDTSKVTKMDRMFERCSALANLNLGEKFDTSNVTTMEYMFERCSSLTNLDLSNFDTTKVTLMGGMFSGCSALTSLDLSNLDTSNVAEMWSMFFGCSALTSLDLGKKFDTSKVTNMSSMFEECSSLTSLDLSNFDTSKVTLMGGMFSGCSALTSLDLSNFDTSNVEYMSFMFSRCSSLTSLNLSNFNTSNVTDMNNMFSYCPKVITEITIENPNISEYVNMFFLAASTSGSQIIVNYTAETLNIVENMINTTTALFNVKKGVQK